MNLKELKRIYRKHLTVHLGVNAADEFIKEAALGRGADTDYPLDRMALESALKLRVTFPVIAYELIKAFLSDPDCLGWWSEETLTKYSKAYLGEVYTDPKVVAVAMEDQYQTFQLHWNVAITHDSFIPVKTIVSEWLPICYPDGYCSGRWWVVSKPRHLVHALKLTLGFDFGEFVEKHPYLIYEAYVLARSLGVDVAPNSEDVAYKLSRFIHSYAFTDADPKVLLDTIVSSHYKPSRSF